MGHPLVDELTSTFAPEVESLGPTAVAAGAARRLGDYELCYELASGGMATIYLARREAGDGLGRPVAIKRLHPHLIGSGEMEDMFLDEARIASQIRHPNVCAVIDVGRAEGSAFLVMEYLAGVTLARLTRAVARRPPVLASARWHALVARIASDAAAGLHAAHELSDGGIPLEVVHRDISPSNVFVTFEGNVKVLDFGVATARNRVRVTKAGKVKGKLSYVAPEQLEGRKADRRADVWGLGLCLWEALAGRRLFGHRTVLEHLAFGGGAPLPPPSSVGPWVPRELDQVVGRALRWDRDERYSSARQMAADLFGFVRARGEPAGPEALAGLLLELFRIVHTRERDVLVTFTSEGVEPSLGTARPEAPRLGRSASTEPPAVETETVRLPPPELSGTNWLELFDARGDEAPTDTTPAGGRAPSGARREPRPSRRRGSS